MATQLKYFIHHLMYPFFLLLFFQFDDDPETAIISAHRSYSHGLNGHAAATSSVHKGYSTTSLGGAVGTRGINGSSKSLTSSTHPMLLRDSSHHRLQQHHHHGGRHSSGGDEHRMNGGAAAAAAAANRNGTCGRDDERDEIGGAGCWDGGGGGGGGGGRGGRLAASFTTALPEFAVSKVNFFMLRGKTFRIRYLQGAKKLLGIFNRTALAPRLKKIQQFWGYIWNFQLFLHHVQCKKCKISTRKKETNVFSQKPSNPCFADFILATLEGKIAKTRWKFRWKCLKSTLH